MNSSPLTTTRDLRSISEHCCLCIILFNPSQANLRELTLLSSLGLKTYVIDNSETPGDYPRFSPSLNYVCNRRNLGVATALNQACTVAYRDGYKSIAIFDQDSFLDKPTLTEYLLDAVTLLSSPKVALVSPKTDPNVRTYLDVDIVHQAISSSSVLSLRHWLEVGKFNDKLFIDQVDHEFCHRLINHGALIYRLNSHRLFHVPGNPLSKHLFGRSYSSTNHNADRRYYHTRNSFYCLKTHKASLRSLSRLLRFKLIEILLILVVEDKEISRKILAIFHGFFDFCIGKYGPRRPH